MPNLHLLRDAGIDVLLSGHGGDLLHMCQAGLYSLDGDLLQIAEPSALAAWLFRRLASRVGTVSVFVPQIQAELEILARESLESAVHAADAPSMPQRVSRLWVTQKLRRRVALELQAVRSVVETRLPFMDNDLLSLALSAPPPLTFGENIHWTIMSRRRPELLRVMDPSTGTRIGAGEWKRGCSTVFMNCLANLGLIPASSGPRFRRWLRPYLARIATDVMLAPVALERGFYDPAGLRNVTESHAAGRRDHTELLLALTTFELGQRHLGTTSLN